jgi:hypothetical protein
MAHPEPREECQARDINVRDAIDVFNSLEAQQAAFCDLCSGGFHHSDISLL